MSRLLGDVVATDVAVEAPVSAVGVVEVDAAAAAGFSSLFRSEKRTIEKHH